MSDKDEMRENFLKRAVLSRFSMNADFGITPDRLIALTDGVYAIAITLLILGLALPEAKFSSDYGLLNFLISQTDLFVTVVISFIVLGDYWIQHHQILQVSRVDIPFLWLNIIYLLVMMFIPFTCSLIGSYGEFAISRVLFGLSILLTSVISLIIYFYAYKSDLLINKDATQVTYTIRSITSLIIISIIIIFLIYFVGPQSILLFLTLPVSSALFGLRYDRLMREKEEAKKQEMIEKTKSMLSSEGSEIAEKSKKAMRGYIFSEMNHDKLSRLENMIDSLCYEYVKEYVDENGENLTSEERAELQKEALENLKARMDSKIED